MAYFKTRYISHFRCLEVGEFIQSQSPKPTSSHPFHQLAPLTHSALPTLYHYSAHFPYTFTISHSHSRTMPFTLPSVSSLPHISHRTCNSQYCGICRNQPSLGTNSIRAGVFVQCCSCRYYNYYGSQRTASPIIFRMPNVRACVLRLGV